MSTDPTSVGAARAFRLDPTRSWSNRSRAEAFGAVAEAYDAVRPRYPDEVVDAVVTGRPPASPAGGRLRVLDVGTGTGILARALVARGADVVGTDIDAEMAAVARRHGLLVHVAPFEGLQLADLPLPSDRPDGPGGDRGRGFDRLTVGQAWHWIRPDEGLAAARRLLAPGGQLWLLWNFGALDPALQGPVDAVYARHTPEVSEHSVTRGGGQHAADLATEQLAQASGADVTTFAVRWQRTYTTQEWLASVSTHSDHLTLPAERREALLAALGEAVDAHGGTARVDYTTHAVVVTGLTP